MPATQSAAGSPATNPAPSTPPEPAHCAPSATPATQNEAGCRQVPCLPRETKVDVPKCQGCYAKCRGVTCDYRAASAPPEPAQSVPSVPRLPRKTKVDVAKCHACHAKGRWMSPSATPATQSAAASPATNPASSAPPEPAQCPQCHTCHAKRKVDVAKCHACHVKRRWMSPGATPTTQSCMCERWCVTKMVCERWCVETWCVTKMWVKDVGVRWCGERRCVTKCDKGV